VCFVALFYTIYYMHGAKNDKTLHFFVNRKSKISI